MSDFDVHERARVRGLRLATVAMFILAVGKVASLTLALLGFP